MQSFLGKRGDSYDRFLIRVREMYESINIVFQVLSNLTNSHKLNTDNKFKDVEFMSFFDFLYGRPWEATREYQPKSTSLCFQAGRPLEATGIPRNVPILI